MKLTLTLDQEATDALQERVDLYNAGSGQPAISAIQFMEQVHCRDFISQLVEQRYQASVARVAAAFRPIPYTERLATVAALEAQTQKP